MNGYGLALTDMEHQPSLAISLTAETVPAYEAVHPEGCIISVCWTYVDQLLFSVLLACKGCRGRRRIACRRASVLFISMKAGIGRLVGWIESAQHPGPCRAVHKGGVLQRSTFPEHSCQPQQNSTALTQLGLHYSYRRQLRMTGANHLMLTTVTAHQTIIPVC